jgi:hypothetical protein
LSLRYTRRLRYGSCGLEGVGGTSGIKSNNSHMM